MSPAHTTVSPRGITSYPPPTTASAVPSPVLPHRALVPLLAHPARSAPSQPVRPAPAPPPPGWVRSYHASPAAFPKELREANGTLDRQSRPFSIAPAKGESKAERKARNVEETRKCVVARYDAHERQTAEEAAEPATGMWQHVERWRREKPTGGLTLVITHANGMQKEHWHTVLRNILARDPTAPGATFGTGSPLPPTAVHIDDIWMLDDANHGGSVDLNAGLLGPAQSWRDDARDVLNFVSHVLPAAKAQGTEAPWHLPWSSDAPAVKVVGLGHSFGGNALAQAAEARPDLFQALFLVDPICPPHIVPRERGVSNPAGEYGLSFGAVKRRDTWPSREAAREAMLATPFYAAWDPRVFDAVLSHGLVDVESGVTLATPSWCEAAVFTEPTGFARGWEALGRLTIPVAFLMAKDTHATLGEPITNEMVWRPRLARNERVMDAGHLIVQEKPDSVADALWRFFTTLQRWGTTEEIRGSGESRAKL